MEKKVGEYSFVIGVIIAIVLGLIADRIGGSVGIALSSLLVLLGLIVGFLNVTSKEVTGFLLATVALMMVGNVGLSLPAVGSFVTSVVSAFISFTAGAAAVVAIKELFVITKSK